MPEQGQQLPDLFLNVEGKQVPFRQWLDDYMNAMGETYDEDEYTALVTTLVQTLARKGNKWSLERILRNAIAPEINK